MILLPLTSTFEDIYRAEPKNTAIFFKPIHLSCPYKCSCCLCPYFSCCSCMCCRALGERKKKSGNLLLHNKMKVIAIWQLTSPSFYLHVFAYYPNPQPNEKSTFRELMALLGILSKSAFLFSSKWRTLAMACIFRRDERLAHRDWNHVGAAGWVFWNSGDVIIGGESGSVVIGVQQVNDDVGGGAESLGCVDLDCKKLKWGNTGNESMQPMQVPFVEKCAHFSLLLCTLYVRKWFFS